MGQKYKYVYNLSTKKLVRKLNEDDNVQTDTTQQSQQQNASTGQQTSAVQSVESNEQIQKINNDLQNIEKKFQNDIAAQKKLLQVAQVNASKSSYNGPYDPAQVDPQVLQVLKKINDLEKQYAIDKHSKIDQRLQVLQSLSKTNERWYTIPEKYKGLNESNLNTAKVYVNTLVGNDTDDKLLKNMHDFKRVFKNTDLLYGKDRNGYFVVAIDGEDINKISNTLEEEGYLRDEILDAIMPQILDRSAMIK